MGDQMKSNRGIVLVVLVPLLLISFLVYVNKPPQPQASSSSSSSKSLKIFSINAHRKLSRTLHISSPSFSSNSSSTYAVIFDAGSSGSRVHVYNFDSNLDLLHVGDELELFEQVSPGLSSYADNVTAAAESLIGLLESAEAAVPEELHSSTPVRVGATAGLRFLSGNTSEEILEAVRDLLKQRSDFKLESDAVAVLDGIQEGSYLWVSINYLLGNLGKEYPNTVGVVDLGGGSVQMAYAISETAYENAPTPSVGEKYVKHTYLNGTDYYLYVHSYLGYGLLAARAGLLNVTGDSGSPCILGGYNGSYVYNGITYNATASSSGSSIDECKKVADKALRISDTCTYLNCTFDGVWNGGGGVGESNLYVGSFFFDKAAQVGFVNSSDHIAKAYPSDFEAAAKIACQTKVKDATSVYPNVIDVPYICMDLVYQYSLLVDGFGLDPWQEITLMKQLKYQDSWVEAVWTLGSAIEAISSSSLTADL
ncbi:Nucleoside phosphatase [Parasponia andersonii]|uniref:Nucleoside phosphatase n=1 Tax=Parasponia andersonii TaxID=3476 RepID=A0A2P5A5N7_PARAD|nr:Nucleoside phosphatase [Parasponia andersonii]